MLPFQLYREILIRAAHQCRGKGGGRRQSIKARVYPGNKRGAPGKAVMIECDADGELFGRSSGRFQKIGIHENENKTPMLVNCFFIFLFIRHEQRYCTKSNVGTIADLHKSKRKMGGYNKRG